MSRLYTNGEDYFCEQHRPEEDSLHLPCVESQYPLTCYECEMPLDCLITEDGLVTLKKDLRDFSMSSDYKFYAPTRSGWYQGSPAFQRWEGILNDHAVPRNALFDLRASLWKDNPPLSTIITKEWHMNPDVQRVYNVMQRLGGKWVIGADIMRKYVRLVEECKPTTEVGREFLNRLVKLWIDYPHTPYRSSAWNTFASLFNILENLKEIENG